MPAISLQNVTKLFGRFAALRNVSAQFERGKLYAVLGENGAGKSTLLRIIAGLARPTSGNVVFEGRGDVSAIRTSLGYMAHAPMLYDEMSGMENLRYFGALYGINDDRKFAEAMGRVGLDSKLARRVGEYSQGMRQRLSLARALMHDPGILLLDEPFSNLDPASAERVSQLLASLRDQGKTVLVVTHQTTHVEKIADDSVVLVRGELGRAASEHKQAAL